MRPRARLTTPAAVAAVVTGVASVVIAVAPVPSQGDGSGGRSPIEPAAARSSSAGAATAPSASRAARITGREQRVFDWSTDACRDEHIPDLPVRAIRDRQGRVQVNISSFVNYRAIGPSLSRLSHPCEVTFSSGFDTRPVGFDNNEWLASPYTRDGRNVYALVHNEFHGDTGRVRCRSGDRLKCWYNAITWAVSRDGGRTYTQARSPRHLVAAFPYRYQADRGPLGIFAPSNIVFNREDRHYYFMAWASRFRSQRYGACLFRSRRLFGQASWRAWDGRGFRAKLASPYGRSGAPQPCEPVSQPAIERMNSSLTYSTYLRRWLLVGAANGPDARGRPSQGVYWSTSRDLVNWSPRRLLKRAEFTWSHRCGDPRPIMYPSLIDPRSPSRSFETVGRRAYLYYTRLNLEGCRLTYDRDLVRVPVDFGR